MGSFPYGFQEREHASGTTHRWAQLWYRSDDLTLHKYDLTWQSKHYADDDPELIASMMAKRDSLVEQGFTIIEITD